MDETKLPLILSIMLIVISLFTLGFVTIFLILSWPNLSLLTLRSLVLFIITPYDMPFSIIAGTAIFWAGVLDVIATFVALACMIAGVLGIVYRKRAEKMGMCVKIGFAIMFLELIVYIATLVLFEMNATRVVGWSFAMLIGVFVPGIYTYAAYQSSKFYRLVNRS